jgi:hypothetical protein
VADSGGGDARERISDLAALPPELSRQSLSRGMIIVARRSVRPDMKATSGLASLKTTVEASGVEIAGLVEPKKVP